jgi:HrpA-like RNA helicase
MKNWKDGRWREPLPIDGHLPEILRLLADNQVVIVEAETGAGKTTRIPQAVLLEHPDVKIWMTQTRRAAVRWNGRRIAAEMGCRPGGIVGWRLFGEEPVVSRETRLTLVIDQSLTNRIRESGGRLPEGLLIIDEAHERSVSTDLLLGLIKEALPSSPNTKVLVTSATIDTRKFSEFFGWAPVISVTGRCYPVATEVVKLESYEHHTGAAARAACDVLERFVQGTLQTPTADGKGMQTVTFGTVIVLLPGKEDIASVMSAISQRAKELAVTDRVQVLSCHGESSPEEQDAVQEDLPERTIRFVCGTEVLRTSVTVRNTAGVIDSLQVKRLTTDAKGVAHLEKIAVSRAEADQAKGRAGRTAPGFYIACSFGNEYETLRPYPIPAILREPITHVALQVAAVGRSVRDFAFIDSPDREKVEVAITRLKRLGALDEQEQITEIGETLVQFPLDPERAKVLVTADRLGVLAEAVIVTAVLESEGIFYGPSSANQESSVLVEEPILRMILARCEKDRWGDWRKREKPGDPATVDIQDQELPSGISREGGLWRICFRYEPTEEVGKYGNLGAFDPSVLVCRRKEFQIGDIRWVADLTRRFFAGDSRSDFVAIVRAYRAFKAEERRLRNGNDPEPEGGHQSREKQLRDWCKRWFVNYKRIRMAENVMRQIREELANSPLHMANGLGFEREFSAEALSKALASGLCDNIARQNEAGYGFSGPLGDFQLAYQSVCPQGSKLILVGGVRKVPVRGRRGGTSFVHLADLAAPLQPEWLSEVMPQLCSKKRLSDYRYDPWNDIVVETQEQWFVDLKVAESPVEATDKNAAAQIFCAWLAQEMANERRY